MNEISIKKVYLTQQNPQYWKPDSGALVHTQFGSAWDRGIRNAICSWHLGKRGSEARLVKLLQDVCSRSGIVWPDGLENLTIANANSGWLLFFNLDHQEVATTLGGTLISRELTGGQEPYWRNASMVS